MLRRWLGLKPKPPTLPLEDRTRSSTIPDGAASASTPLDASNLPVRDFPVHDVTDADFDAVVLQSDRLVVVDVWAEWCQPCTIMSAYAEWLARDYGERLLVVALDADENPTVPEQYAILGLPTLLFFRGGVEVGRQVGLLSYEELHEKVAAFLGAATGQD